MSEVNVPDIPAEVTEARRACREALAGAAARWTRARPRVGVLYSGGLDSSLTALLLAAHASVTLWTLGLPGSSDLPAARSGAVSLGLPLREIPIVPADVLTVLATPDAGWVERPEPERSVRLSLFLGLRGCGENTIALGQGADELFYGYARYARLTRRDAVVRAGEDYRRLADDDWPWTAKIASSFGREVGSLFLDDAVVESARRLPPPRSSMGEPPKHHLRVIARELGLPGELADRPKRALQYGSGIERLVRRVVTRRADGVPERTPTPA